MLDKIKQSDSGFTLVEILISILILSVILTGGIQYAFNADKITALLKHKKFATELTNSIMEDLKGAGYANLPAAGAGTPVAISTTEDPLGIIRNSLATKTITVTDIGTPVEYKQVEVIVAWTEAGASTPRINRVVTFIAP